MLCFSIPMTGRHRAIFSGVLLLFGFSCAQSTPSRRYLNRKLLCHAGGWDQRNCATCMSHCGICDPSCHVPSPAPTSSCRPLDGDGLLSKGAFEAMNVGAVRVLKPSVGRFGVGCATSGAEDSDFSFLVRRGASTTRVVVEFQGGGACWDYETCHAQQSNFVSVDPQLLGLDCTDWTAYTSAVFGKGFSDPTDGANPVKDWSYVFIPYCTKDIHLGTNVTRTYVSSSSSPSSSSVMMRHNGHANALSALEWVKATFPQPRAVLLTGCSAGSIGAAVHAATLSDHYAVHSPGANVMVIGDSFFLVPAGFARGAAEESSIEEQGDVEWGGGGGVTAWGAQCLLWQVKRNAWDDSSDGGGGGGSVDYSRALWEGVGEKLKANGHGPLLALSSLEDGVQARFWGDMGGHPSEFSARLLHTLTSSGSSSSSSGGSSVGVLAAVDSSFVFAGTSHCTTSGSAAFSLPNRSSTLDPWLEAATTYTLDNKGGDSSSSSSSSNATYNVLPSVACTRCSLAFVPGCDGAVGSAAAKTLQGLEDNCGVCAANFLPLSSSSSSSPSTSSAVEVPPCMLLDPLWLKECRLTPHPTPHPTYSPRPTPSPTWSYAQDPKNGKRGKGGGSIVVLGGGKGGRVGAALNTAASWVASWGRGQPREVWWVSAGVFALVCVCWCAGRREKAMWRRRIVHAHLIKSCRNNNAGSNNKIEGNQNKNAIAAARTTPNSVSNNGNNSNDNAHTPAMVMVADIGIFQVTLGADDDDDDGDARVAGNGDDDEGGIDIIADHHLRNSRGGVFSGDDTNDTDDDDEDGSDAGNEEEETSVALAVPTLVLGLARTAHSWPLLLAAATVLPSAWLGYVAWSRQPVEFDLDFEAYLTSDGLANDNWVHLQELENNAARTVCAGLSATTTPPPPSTTTISTAANATANATTASVAARRLSSYYSPYAGLGSTSHDGVKRWSPFGSSTATTTTTAKTTATRTMPRGDSRSLNTDAEGDVQEVVRLLYSPWRPFAENKNTRDDDADAGPHSGEGGYGGPTALTPLRVQAMRRVESTLLCDASFRAHCAKPGAASGGGDACAPLLSLAPLFFRQGLNSFGESSGQEGGGVVGSCPALPAATGGGEEEEGVATLRDDFRGTLRLLATSQEPPLAQGYLATSFSADNPVTPVCVTHLVLAGRSKAELHKYLTTVLLPWLRDKASTRELRVSWFNQEMANYEILEALAFDGRLAGGGFALVVVCIAYSTASLLLTLGGILCITLSIPIAYWEYASILHVTRMPLLNFFGLFVVIGIGADGIFLIRNTFKTAHAKALVLYQAKWRQRVAGRRRRRRRRRKLKEATPPPPPPRDGIVANPLMGVSTAAVPVLHTETNSNANANPTSVPTATTRQRRQLRKGKSCSVDPPNRLQRRNEVLCLAKAVYCRAGCSLLATTATTSGSFFANLASSLPVLREFGQFVGLVVAANYALTMTLFVAALVLHHRRCCFAGVVANTCRRRRRHRHGAGDDLDEDDADVEDGSGGGDNDEEARPDDDNDDEEAVDDIDGEIVNGGGDDNRSTDSSVAGSDQKDADITADPSPPPPPLPPPSSPPPPRSTSTSSTKKSDNRNKSRSALVRRYVFFLQRRRFLMACGCLTGVLLLFGWGAAKAKSASDPPQLFNQDHNLGVAYDLWGLVGGSVGANEGSANGANTAPQQPSSTLGGGLGSSGGGGGGTPAPVPSPTQPAPTPPPPSSPTPSPAGSTTAAPTPHPIPAPPPSAAAFSSHPSPPPSSTNRPTLSPNPNPTAPSLNPTLTSQPTPLPTEAARKNTVTVSLFWDLVLNKDGSGGASEVPLLERTGPRDKQEKAEAEAEEGGGEAGTLSESEQALLLWTCLEAMKDPTLQVVRRDSSCFMLDLHEWLTGEKQGAGLPLPPSQFRDRALDFYYAQGGDPDPTAAPGDIGVAPPSSSSPPSAQWKYASLDCGSGELLWLRAEFKTRLPSSAKASDVLAFFDDDWTRFARTANERYAAAARDDATAAAAAGNNSNDVDLDDVVTDGGESAAPSSSAATQTERARRSKALAKPRLRVKVASWAWVRASTEVQMVGSTLTAFAVSFGVACACVLGFTQNLRVSVAAMLGVLCVNLALVAFMVLGLEWALGAVEAVAITVFVGFSVDYIIHVAHGYASFPPPSLPPASSPSSSSSSPLSERGKQGDDNDSDDGDDENGGCGGHGVRVGENNDDDCTGGDKDGVRVGDEEEGVFGVSIMRGEEGRDSEEFKEGVASEDDVEVDIEVGKGVEDGVNRIQYEKRKKGETPCSANRSRSSGTGGGGSSCCGNSCVGRRGEATTTTTTTGRDRARDAAAEHLAETLETIYPSIVGAALTSGVSAVSLALCTVQIFVKMGLTLLCCTALSALFALLVLPAFLLAFAPQTAPPSPLTPQPRSLQHKDNSETKASTRVATRAAARAAATLPGAEAVTEVASGPLYTSSAVLESSSSSSKFGVAVTAGSFQLHDIGSSLGYAEVGLGNRTVVL